MSQKGSKYAFLQISDPTGVFEVIIFSETFFLSSPGSFTSRKVVSRKINIRFRFYIIPFQKNTPSRYGFQGFRFGLPANGALKAPRPVISPLLGLGSKFSFKLLFSPQKCHGNMLEILL